MIINRGHKYRIYPTDEQKEILLRMFGCARKCWNHFLNERNEQYKEWKNLCSIAEQANQEKPSKPSEGWITYNRQQNSLPQLKKQNEFEWLNVCPSQTYQRVLRDLDNAFSQFLKKKKGHPQFHKFKRHQSFSVSQQITIVSKNHIKCANIKEPIRFVKTDKLPCRVKVCSATISCDGHPKSKGTQFYVSFNTEETYQPRFNHTSKEVGIDLGLIDKIVTSDGQKFKSVKFYKKLAKKLRKADQHLSRKRKYDKETKTPSSKRYETQASKRQRLFTKLSNCRKDYNHKLSKYIVENYDVVKMEKLNIKNMLRNHRLASSISNECWYQLQTYIKYKCEWEGKTFKTVNPRNTSKTCSNCGYILDKKMSLATRRWICPKCGSVLDRDVNASINILVG